LAKNQGVLPLICFEISQHTEVATFVAATKIAKYLTCDVICSAVLLNVSTALLALSTTSEPRCRFIDIGPFTDDQASLYLKKLEEIGMRKLNDEQREMVFEKLGTYPYQLWALVNSPLDPASYVEFEVGQCESKVLQSIGISSKYRAILNHPYKTIREVEALQILGAPTLKDVGRHMREFQVLNYHPKAPGSFTFRTKAIETAVISYLDKNEL